MSIEAGGASVTVRIDDLTTPGLRSAMANLSKLEAASKRAAAASMKAVSPMLRAVPGQGMVMQPFSGASRLDLLGSGGNQITPAANVTPYGIENPALDRMRERQRLRGEMKFGARDVGFIPPAFVRDSRTVAESMRLASKSAGDLEGRFGRLTGVSAKFATRVAGAGVAFAGLSSILTSVVDAIEDKANGANESFWDRFQTRFAEAARSIPILGTVFRAVFAQQFAAIDRLKRETEALVAVGEKQRSLVLSRQQGSLATEDRLRESRLDRDQALIESSNAGFETEESVESMRQLERERARLRRDQFATEQMERARAEGVSERSTGIGGARFRQMQQEVEELYANELQAIDAVYERRLSNARAEKEARIRDAEEEAAAKLAAEREVAARIEELQLDQQDRLALARLDAQEASIGPEDTVQNRVRQAEIAAQRELLSLQQQLDQAEARILDQKGLTAEQRNAAIEAERQIAELQAQTIREGVERARRGEDKAEQVAAAAGAGTFSSFAASRINTDTTALMKQQVKYLQTIASNTRQQAGFAP